MALTSAVLFERLASTSSARQLIAKQSMRGDDDTVICIDQIIGGIRKESCAVACSSLLPAVHCAAMSREALAGRIGMSRKLGLGRGGRAKGLVVQCLEIFLHRAWCIVGVSHTGCPVFKVAGVLFLEISTD